MEEQTWKKIWQKREFNLQNENNQEEIFIAMKRAAGFDLVEEGLGYKEFLEQWKRNDLNMTFSYSNKPINSIYEVGCGAGANLYLYQCFKNNYELGGIDYSETMLNYAKRYIKSNDLKLGEAIDIDENKQYDIVLSNGVFPYFPDYNYANKVLDKMLKKTRNSIALLDIFDINKKEEFINYRKSIIENYDEKYKNLNKLFFSKDFFIKFAEKNDLDIKFSKPGIPSYYNDKFVFDIYLYKK